ncbi:hypothetical protein BH10ACT10_BH10ACT10_21870 [soil metagenome]
MAALSPAWPPGASRSTMTVLSPSDAAYTPAASPAGPPPTMQMSSSGRWALVCMPSAPATSRVECDRRVSPSGTSTSGRSSVSASARCCSRVASASRSTSYQR